MQIKKYKGLDIDFNESTDVFGAYKDGDRIAEAPSLRKLEKHLDIVTKKAFNRLPIYKYDTGELVEGEITSFNSLQKEVWITYSEKKYREKVSLRWSHQEILHKTPDNLKLSKEISSLQSQAQRLDSKIYQLRNKLTTYTYGELCKLTGQNPVD